MDLSDDQSRRVGQLYSDKDYRSTRIVAVMLMMCRIAGVLGANLLKDVWPNAIDQVGVVDRAYIHNLVYNLNEGSYRFNEWSYSIQQT